MEHAPRAPLSDALPAENKRGSTPAPAARTARNHFATGGDNFANSCMHAYPRSAAVSLPDVVDLSPGMRPYSCADYRLLLREGINAEISPFSKYVSSSICFLFQTDDLLPFQQQLYPVRITCVYLNLVMRQQELLEQWLADCKRNCECIRPISLRRCDVSLSSVPYGIRFRRPFEFDRSRF